MKTARKVLLACLATAATVVAAEAGLRWFLPPTEGYVVLVPGTDRTFHPDPVSIPGVSGPAHYRNQRVWRGARAAGAVVSEPPDRLPAALDEYRSNLEPMIVRAHDAGGRMLLVTQPSLWRPDNSPEELARLWMGGSATFPAGPPLDITQPRCPRRDGRVQRGDAGRVRVQRGGLRRRRGVPAKGHQHAVRRCALHGRGGAAAGGPVDTVPGRPGPIRGPASRKARHSPGTSRATSTKVASCAGGILQIAQVLHAPGAVAHLVARHAERIEHGKEQVGHRGAIRIAKMTPPAERPAAAAGEQHG